MLQLFWKKLAMGVNILPWDLVILLLEINPSNILEHV